VTIIIDIFFNATKFHFIKLTSIPNPFSNLYPPSGTFSKEKDKGIKVFEKGDTTPHFGDLTQKRKTYH